MPDAAMNRLPFLPWVPLFLALLAPCARGNAPTPMSEDDTRAEDLVRRLGDHSFEAREQASKELLRLGLAAKPALLAGARDPDLEIRRRCRDLLPAILEADRLVRLEAFIADKEGKRTHDLPGWERYRRVAGEDTAARELFAAMQRREAAFLTDAAKDPNRAGEACAALCGQLYQKLYGGPSGSGRPLDLADIAPLLLVAGDSRTRVPDPARGMVGNFLYQPQARAALTTPGSPFRKLALAWMERQTDDENAARQMFFMAGNLDLKEGVDLALKVVRDRKLHGRGLASALTVLGKLGGKEQTLVLESFLGDARPVATFVLNKERGKTQVRDVALAMLVHLNGGDHIEYGFAFSRTSPHLKFSPDFLGFRNDKQRARAFARWKERNSDTK
jgi:hypothetical protein